MKILGIETSCDETGTAVVENGIRILSNIVASSKDVQKKFGGIIPEQAAREQIKCIIPVLQEALTVEPHLQNGWHYCLQGLVPRWRVGPNPSAQEPDHPPTGRARYRLVSGRAHHLKVPWVAGSSKDTLGMTRRNLARVKESIKAINAIAVTVGPGLIGSLLVGVETAKTLAFVFNKPLIPVNHLLGHIYASWLIQQPETFNQSFNYAQNRQPTFPTVCLIVSGGHTLLVLMRDHGKFHILGETRDDAAGEAFDKIGRLLGLSYPGGPAIQKAALGGNPLAFDFPRPMIDSDDYDFSFSGLKTAVLREVRKIKSQIPDYKFQILISDLAASVQEAIVDVLVEKTLRAAREYKVKSIIVGGGVAANKRLKEKFMVYSSWFMVHIPSSPLCTDNAAVVASAAYFNYKPFPWQKVAANPSLEFPA